MNILITGAARGIGHVLVRRALLRGDTVFSCIRKESDKLLFDDHEGLSFVIMDVSDSTVVSDAFKALDVALAGQKLDAVIHSAAISSPGALELTGVGVYESILNTNALGAVRVLQQAIPRLRGHGGRAILLTSLWGVASSAMLSAYCMSKHAVEALADAVRRETQGMNLHVIVVEPGVVRTDMYASQAAQVQNLLDKMTEEQKSIYGGLYKNYKKIVADPGESHLPAKGISSDECAMVIEMALMDKVPKTRYQAGDDARRMVELVKSKSDEELDGILNSVLPRV